MSLPFSYPPRVWNSLSVYSLSLSPPAGILWITRWKGMMATYGIAHSCIYRQPPSIRSPFIVSSILVVLSLCHDYASLASKKGGMTCRGDGRDPLWEESDSLADIGRLVVDTRAQRRHIAIYSQPGAIKGGTVPSQEGPGRSPPTKAIQNCSRDKPLSSRSSSANPSCFVSSYCSLVVLRSLL